MAIEEAHLLLVWLVRDKCSQGDPSHQAAATMFTGSNLEKSSAEEVSSFVPAASVLFSLAFQRNAASFLALSPHLPAAYFHQAEEHYTRCILWSFTVTYLKYCVSKVVFHEGTSYAPNIAWLWPSQCCEKMQKVHMCIKPQTLPQLKRLRDATQLRQFRSTRKVLRSTSA